MQRDNTARRSCAPENYPTPQVTVTPESALPESTNALGQSAIKTAIVIAGAVGLIALFWFLPTLATGLLFAGALFGVNTLVDGKMGGRNDE